MGLFNFSISNLYNKAKDFATNLYSGVKTGVGALKQAKDWVSEHIDKLSSIPFVGDLVKEGVDKVGNTPIFDGFALKDLGRGIDLANNWINSQYISETATTFDGIASGLASGADKLLEGRAG